MLSVVNNGTLPISQVVERSGRVVCTDAKVKYVLEHIAQGVFIHTRIMSDK